MAYTCDLPANMGNNDIFRAIYAKLSDIKPSTVTIEQKLDVIQDQLTVVNNNIEANAKVIKDTSLNINVDVKVDTGKICDSIDKVNESINTLDNNINSGFNRTIRTIKETRPRPKPVQHCQPQHPRPYPCMPIPEPIYDCHHHSLQLMVLYLASFPNSLLLKYVSYFKLIFNFLYLFSYVILLLFNFKNK